MMLRRCLYAMFLAIMFSTALVACSSAAGDSIPLATFTESHVDVSIDLERSSEGEYILSGTFLPPQGYHLYSKDIPLTGVDGLGRPTLLELSSDSTLKATGKLTESVASEVPDFEPKELRVYPAGPVTLSLPIELPPGDGWSEQEILVTYMACSPSLCMPPVVARRVLVALPGAAMFDEQGK